VGGGFEERRAELARESVAAFVQRLRTGFSQADRLALDGAFDELRTHLAALEGRLPALDGLTLGDEERQALEALRTEIAGRRARVDDQERFFLANLERAERRAVGEALGPGSGIPLCATLASEATLAQGALDSLRREFTGGGWRRKQLTDPRIKRPREVQEVRPEGLVFEKGGGDEFFPWQAAGSDPEWWQLLFQARLSRDWSAQEQREIVSLLRLVGATRGALLARQVIDPHARGLLPPGDVEALRQVFATALAWIPEGDSVLRATIQQEASVAQRLADALEAAQARAWTSASAHLEVLLEQRVDSLLVALLSDGSEWRPGPPETPVPPANGSGEGAPVDAGSAEGPGGANQPPR